MPEEGGEENDVGDPRVGHGHRTDALDRGRTTQVAEACGR
jgi:hypothetical protein